MPAVTTQETLSDPNIDEAQFFEVMAEKTSTGPLTDDDRQRLAEYFRGQIWLIHFALGNAISDILRFQAMKDYESGDKYYAEIQDHIILLNRDLDLSPSLESSITTTLIEEKYEYVRQLLKIPTMPDKCPYSVEFIEQIRNA